MDKLKNFVKGQELHFIKTGQTVKEAVALMSEKNIGAVCVLDGDRLAGMFTERDLMRRVVDHETLNAAGTIVDDVMTKEVTVADASETISDALKKMRQNNCRHMPVIENKKLIGIVSLRKLLLHNISMKDEEIKMLDAYISHYPMGGVEGADN